MRQCEVNVRQHAGVGAGSTLDLDSEAQIINWRILLGLTPLTFLRLQF